MYQHHNPYQTSQYPSSYNGGGYHHHTPYYQHHHPSHQHPIPMTPNNNDLNARQGGVGEQQQQQLGQNNPSSNNALGQLLQFHWSNPVKTESEANENVPDYQMAQHNSSLEYHRKCVNDFAQAQQRLQEQCESENRSSFDNNSRWNFGHGNHGGSTDPMSSHQATRGGANEKRTKKEEIPTDEILSLTSMVAREANDFYEEKKRRLGEEEAEEYNKSCSSKSEQDNFSIDSRREDSTTDHRSSSSSSSSQIKIPEVEMDFAIADLALATVPGMNFDPKSRSFSVDELKPQPIIKKRGKTFVPNEQKDGQYWEKRHKNNEAARRSREARRLKENQIALRAAYLEMQNQTLKKTFTEITDQNLTIKRDVETIRERIRTIEGK